MDKTTSDDSKAPIRCWFCSLFIVALLAGLVTLGSLLLNGNLRSNPVNYQSSQNDNCEYCEPAHSTAADRGLRSFWVSR